MHKPKFDKDEITFVLQNYGGSKINFDGKKGVLWTSPETTLDFKGQLKSSDIWKEVVEHVVNK